MEINGLPLHVLIVHAAVVFGPLAALSALAYVGLPSWRDRLRWVTLGRWSLIGVRVDLGGLPQRRELLRQRPRSTASAARPWRRSSTHEELRRDACGWIVSGFAVVTVLADLAARADRRGRAYVLERAGRRRRGAHAGLDGPHRRRRRPGGLGQLVRRLAAGGRAAAGTTPPARGRPARPRPPRRARTPARRCRACSRAGSPRSARRGRGTPRSGPPAARARARRTGSPACR